MYKVLLIDDYTLWTDLLTRSFADHPTIQIIGTGASARQLWDFLKTEQPDLLLLDLYLDDDVRDLSLAKRVKQTYPAIRVVILSGASQNARMIQQANQYGLDGYLSKRITHDELVSYILKAEQGEPVFSSEVKDVLIQITRNVLPELTPKENDILMRLDMGMKRASIIQALHFRSENTYDSHVHHMKEKFGVKSTSELLRKAAELGYI